jgi:hypothetical protein
MMGEIRKDDAGTEGIGRSCLMGKRVAFKAPVLREIVDPEARWTVAEMEMSGVDMDGLLACRGGWHE